MPEGSRRGSPHTEVGKSKAEMLSPYEDTETTGIDAIVDPKTKGGLDQWMIEEEEKGNEK